jgi:hypothetical protein
MEPTSNAECALLQSDGDETKEAKMAGQHMPGGETRISGIDKVVEEGGDADCEVACVGSEHFGLRWPT